MMSWQRDTILLFLAIGLFFCIGLAARPYLTPSEARYIEIPLQMLATGDWLTPRLNGVPYFEKPPLFYWMQASVMQWFGSGEFAGRIVTAVLATFTCLVTYATARLLYGRLSGLLAAGVLATCVLGYGLSRIAMPDMPVSLFLTCCVACFLAAQHAIDKTTRRNFYLLMYVAAALAVMSKGLIGIVIPGMVIGAWIIITKRWYILKEARLFTGLIIVFAITAPWHVLMAGKHPDFLNFYFIHEHFTRYLTDEHKRNQPWWFFIAIAPAGLLPWTFVTPHALRGLLTTRGMPQQVRHDNLFLLLWIFLPLVFFSTSHSKLVGYIFPIFPPLAILLGHYVGECWKGRVTANALRLNIYFIAVLFASALFFNHLAPLHDDELKQIITSGGLLPMTIPVVIALTLLLFATLIRRPAPVLIGMLAAFAMVTDISVNYIAATLDRSSVKPLAAMVNERLRPEDMVVAYDTYFQDLPVYLNRNVTVAGWTGELGFGVEHYPETRDWMISTDEFWQRCASFPQNIYVFMKKDTFDGMTLPPDSCRLHAIATYGKNMLLEKEAK